MSTNSHTDFLRGARRVQAVERSLETYAATPSRITSDVDQSGVAIRAGRAGRRRPGLGEGQRPPTNQQPNPHHRPATDGLGRELGPRGIAANLINPAPIGTDLNLVDGATHN